MHSKMQSHAAQEWSGLRSCYSLIGFIQWPSCYQSRSYNVHIQCACSLPVSLKSLQLVTKLSLKSLQCVCSLPNFSQVRPPECLSPTVPLFVTKHPHACQQCPPKKDTYTHLDMSNCNRGNQAHGPS